MRNLYPRGPHNIKFNYTSGALLSKPYLHFTLSQFNISKPSESFRLSYNNL